MIYLEIKLSKKDREKAEKFAEARTRSSSSSCYKERGGFKPSDIVVGAMAEIGVYELLHEAGIKVNEPDFKIYSKSKKSFNADLTDGKRFFHVKGQQLSSAKTYSCSWLMQRKDPIINRPQAKHYLVTTNVDLDRNIVMIYSCVPLITLVKNDLIGECVVPRFRENKVAIYLDDIVKKLPASRRWSVLYTEVKA